MPVICDKYNVYFTHVPKNGGSFVEQFLLEHLDGKRVGPKHATYRKHPPERDIAYRVFVVRDPVSWYRSYWAYARSMTNHPSAWPVWGDKHHPTYPLDISCGARTFENFIRKVLHHFPNGFVRAMNCRFLNGTSHALRADHLYDDLEWLLADVGFAEPKIVHDRPLVNVTRSKYKDMATLPDELEAELRAVDHLGGLDIPYVPSLERR